MKIDILTKFVRDVEGATDAIVRDDYTHYTKNGNNVTKVRSPAGNIAVDIYTAKIGTKIVGETLQEGYAGPNPLNVYLQGKLGDVKAFWNKKAQGERPLPSWLERALTDHLRHFYSAK